MGCGEPQNECRIGPRRSTKYKKLFFFFFFFFSGDTGGRARTFLTAIWWTSRNCPTLACWRSNNREFVGTARTRIRLAYGRGPNICTVPESLQAVPGDPLRSRLRVGGDGLTPGCGPRGGGGPGGAPGLHPGPAVQGQSLAAPRAGPGPPRRRACPCSSRSTSSSVHPIDGPRFYPRATTSRDLCTACRALIIERMSGRADIIPNVSAP